MGFLSKLFGKQVNKATNLSAHYAVGATLTFDSSAKFPKADELALENDTPDPKWQSYYDKNGKWPNGKIRVRLRAFDVELIDQSAKAIVQAVQKAGAKVSGPIPLPTRINKVTVLRSPHVNKKSREQFEMRTHKRLIDVIKPSAKAVEALNTLELPAGVEIEIKL